MTRDFVSVQTGKISGVRYKTSWTENCGREREEDGDPRIKIYNMYSSRWLSRLRVSCEEICTCKQPPRASHARPAKRGATVNQAERRRHVRPGRTAANAKHLGPYRDIDRSVLRLRIGLRSNICIFPSYLRYVFYNVIVALLTDSDIPRASSDPPRNLLQRCLTASTAPHDARLATSVADWPSTFPRGLHGFGVGI